ncbi:hypothetical protein BATDEDRAFT_22348 [Batrachochytrium dendrobatidis JAM81]|uniref:CRAL-TRIO domain-containing protein n=2 Tax=Batrachochytrium dendrobatidis TaxID=109871 RepID=F4NTW7_BATDJ|nr:uncharacterized protein BATDEDRAFT_22348 [Batrachochytrium dendrobatidis JAM81]EGF84362.1 hypothetical protein BATDEDRAFT_22348 [Batrachochytrium dendrobatidis JAM81]|eukprot:XP_006675542.1 hypothetical protein BATDEDRAFT_22348 [Batrachochytrium dendrobatidis JAM81]
MVQKSAATQHQLEEYQILYDKHAAHIAELQCFLEESITQNRTSLSLSAHELVHFAELILDKALLLRFFKKHKFSMANTQAALIAHIDWRLTHNLSQLCFEMLSPRTVEYLQKGLFQFWKTDLKGLPVLHITPRHFIPSSDGTELEDLRLCVIFILEVGRRWIQSLNQNDPSIAPASALSDLSSLKASTCSNEPVPIFFQCTVVVDLSGFGMSNINYELLPLFLEIFQKHFPQFIGQVLVLNYGWIHAGIWSVLRTGLSADATEKLRFISTPELIDYIPPECIPISVGGLDCALPLSPYICPIITSFGSSVPPIQQTRAHECMMDRLACKDEEIDDFDFETQRAGMLQSPMPASFMSPVSTVHETWFDAQSAFSLSSSSAYGTDMSEPHHSRTPTFPPISVRSAADLQLLLRVQEYRSGSGLPRTPSSRSLTSLTNFKLSATPDASINRSNPYFDHLSRPSTPIQLSDTTSQERHFRPITRSSTTLLKHNSQTTTTSSSTLPSQSTSWIPYLYTRIFGHRSRTHFFARKPRFQNAIASKSMVLSPSTSQSSLTSSFEPESEHPSSPPPAGIVSWLHKIVKPPWRVIFVIIISALIGRRLWATHARS